MAVTLTYSNVTIRGITYSKGSSFKCASAQSGNGGSEGNAGSASALTVGTTYYFHAKATGDKVTYPYAIATTSGGSVKGWYKEAIFPYATYSVKYNANGGSGAPAAQTKTYGTNLTLSSTKPTRTGYTFQGWGTSASDTSVNYAAGATYSTNAAITLYAIWQANTYAISFNANGGSGAPAGVTKTYGVNLKLPSTVPTRTNYEFLGWSESSSASTATYSAGSTFTKNAKTTLYAVWKLKYTLPTITNLEAVRCGADGTPDDFGTYAKVTFNWSCSQLTGTNNVSSITVNGTVVSASGTSGSVSMVIGGSLSIETTHTITVKVIDTLKSSGSGTTTKTTTLAAAKFVIDFLSGGKGVAFGKAAETENLMDVALNANFQGNVYGMVRGLGELPAIPDSTDINTYKTPGAWSVRGNANAATMTNMPTKCAGVLEVSMCTGHPRDYDGWLYVRQKFIPYDLSYPTYERDFVYNTETKTWSTDNWVAHDYLPTKGGVLTGDVYTNNACALFGKTANGKDVALLQLSSTDTYLIGYGMYGQSIGETRLYGNIVYLNSKGDIRLVPYGNSYGYIRIMADTSTSRLIFCPSENGKAYCGGSNYRWQTVFAINAFNQSSDRRLKTDISDDFSKLEALFDRLTPVTYKLKEDEEEKIRFGFVAQDVEKALEDSGYDPDKFALLTKDQNETGDDFIYGLGYTEFSPLNTAMIQLLKKKVSEQQETIENQQNKINDLESRLTKLEALLGVE